MTNDDLTAGDLQPQERCPTCGGAVEHVSREPLEEFCSNVPCDYYRAKGMDGEVIRA
jgi:uncharacterized protein with PIN domain